MGVLIEENELTLLRVAVGSGVALGGLRAILPDAELLKALLNPIVLVFTPVALIYFSSKFGFKKGEKFGFLWLFGFTPVALLIVR